MVTRRLLAAASGPAGVIAVAVALTASIGFAATLTVTSAHLTVLEAPVGPPDGPGDPGGPGACPSPCVLTAVADAYVSNAEPSANFGSATVLRTNPHTTGQGPSTNHRLSYVRFDLATLPPGATISSATLTLHRESTGTRTYGVQPVSTHWEEGSVTWNDRPTVTGTEVQVQVTGSTATWNVTAHVQGFHAQPQSNHGWRLRDATNTANNTSVFRSREHSTGPGPTLIVTYTLPEGG